MTKLMTGYDIVVKDGLVHIKPGHMVEFTDPSSTSPLQSPQARRLTKADFEAGFDKAAKFVLGLEDLPAGEIRLMSDVAWEEHFRDAIVRALEADGQKERKVTIVQNNAAETF